MRIGFANGVFDLFHDGHRHFLDKARLHCDHLVVAVDTDENVKILKGALRPKWPLLCRMSHVRPYAHTVVPCDGDTLSLIKGVNPHILIRGRDQSVLDEEWAGRTLVVIHRLPGVSTTELIERSLHETD